MHVLRQYGETGRGTYLGVEADGERRSGVVRILVLRQTESDGPWYVSWC